MLVAFWIVGGVTALLNLAAGGNKLFRSKDALRPMMGWVDVTPYPLLRFIGIAEILGGLGIVLPPLTGIVPWLAIVAAAGIVLIQLAAIVFHIVRREFSALGFNAVILALAGVTVWLATVWL